MQIGGQLTLCEYFGWNAVFVISSREILSTLYHLHFQIDNLNNTSSHIVVRGLVAHNRLRNISKSTPNNFLRPIWFQSRRRLRRKCKRWNWVMANKPFCEYSHLIHLGVPSRRSARIAANNNLYQYYKAIEFICLIAQELLVRVEQLFWCCTLH